MKVRAPVGRDHVRNRAGWTCACVVALAACGSSSNDEGRGRVGDSGSAEASSEDVVVIVVQPQDAAVDGGDDGSEWAGDATIDDSASSEASATDGMTGGDAVSDAQDTSVVEAASDAGLSSSEAGEASGPDAAEVSVTTMFEGHASTKNEVAVQKGSSGSSGWRRARSTWLR